MNTTPEAAQMAPAVWIVKHRWLAAVLLALVPVVLTAAGSAAGQVLGLEEVAAVWLIAASAAVSAIVGLLVMRASGQRYRAYGFARPVRARTAWWFVPLAVTVLLVPVTGGVAISGKLAVAYGALVVMVAVNEETWFRGITIALLRPAGIRAAVIGSAVLFGVLHLANLAGGADPTGALLQLVFALIFGLIAAELAVLTRSLWPAIVWHAAWDFASYLGGNSSAPLALAAVGVACVLMLAYAVRLWRPTMKWGSGPEGERADGAQ